MTRTEGPGKTAHGFVISECYSAAASSRPVVRRGSETVSNPIEAVANVTAADAQLAKLGRDSINIRNGSTNVLLR